MSNKFEEDLRKIIKLYEDGLPFNIAVKKVKSNQGKEDLCKECKYNKGKYCFKQRCKV